MARVLHGYQTTLRSIPREPEAAELRAAHSVLAEYRSVLAEQVGIEAARELLGETLRSVFSRSALLRPLEAGEHRSWSTSTSGIAVAPSIVAQDVVRSVKTLSPLTAAIQVRDYTGRGINSASVPRITTAYGLPTSTAEGASITALTDPVFGSTSVVFTAHKATAQASQELIDDASVDVPALLDELFTVAMADRFEQLLCNDATNGIWLVSGANTAAAAAANAGTVTDVVKARNTLTSLGWRPSAAAFHPTDWAKLTTAADSTGRLLCPSPEAFRAATGLEPLVTTRGTAATVVVGDFVTPGTVENIVRSYAAVSESKAPLFGTDGTTWKLGLRSAVRVNSPTALARITAFS
jgi:HK97 family phage major capsid protein